MNVILFTQEDPFYLPLSTKDLIDKLSCSNHKIVQSIITPPSVFGKKESFFKKLKKTFEIFGMIFFLFYSIKYIKNKFILKLSVEKVLNKAKIPTIKISNSINHSSNVDLIKKLNADLILIIAGNQIINKEILNSTKYGVFNVHSSLLPFYKGLMPSFWVLKNKEKYTGVTLYKLTEGIDDGPIIASRKIKITENETQSTLVLKLKILANDLIVSDLDKIKNIKDYKSNKGGSYFSFPTKKDVALFRSSNGKLI